MKKNEPIFEYLESIAELIPVPFYWLDVNAVYLGLNTLSVEGLGALKKEDIIGKDTYGLYKNKEVADKLQTTIDEVLCTGVQSQTEDRNIDMTGRVRYFSSTRAALRNKKNEIIGIVGTSIEITAEKEKFIAEKETERLKHENHKLEAQNKLNQIILEKEAAESERLRLENQVHKLENEKHKIAAKEQERFKKIVGQVVHDIQSPLAGLRGIVEDAAGSIPEAKRITLRQASMRISDIAQHMLSRYKNKPDSNERSEPLLVSTTLQAILSEKRFEHRNTIIDTEIRANAHFAFIQIEPSHFKRMISNIINNAVQALNNKPGGEVKVELSITSEWVYVFIEDNGCGMSQDLVDKIESNVITPSKADGSDLGLIQVRETLQRNYGELSIDSVEDNYTIIMLKFPKILPPFWIAEEIKIIKGDTIVVLDDDPSIHGAWDMKLRPLLAKAPDIKVNHYTEGRDAVDFINSLSAEEKEQICLLADYELLNQGINGLEVIEQTKIRRSTLVTSHYNDPEIRGNSANLRVKILPKPLAFAIPINLDKRIEPGSKKVDMVWVDDARWFIRDWKVRFANLVIDEYYDPESFLEDVYQYPLDTKIVLDRNYYDGEGEGRKYLGDGLDVAKKLHKLGYTRLFMITGEEPEANIIPKYLKIILKEEDDKIKELAKL